MTSNTSLLTRGDRLWATSQQKEENRAPWWGYNKRSAAGWYLGHPRKGEHQSDALTFQSTTIDNNSRSKLDDLLGVPCSCGGPVGAVLECDALRRISATGHQLAERLFRTHFPELYAGYEHT